MIKKILLVTLALVTFSAVLTFMATVIFSPMNSGITFFDASARQEQLYRMTLPLKIIYPNKRTDKDSASNTADTLDIGVIGKGNLAPVAVSITIKVRDADVSATPDSIGVTWQAGIGGFYETVGAATPVLDTLRIASDTTNTFVFNTTGAATARNAGGQYVWPYCDAIRVIIKDASVVTDDSVSYVIKAMGIYESGRMAYRIPVRYKNKGTAGDSVAATATPDTVRIGITAFGDAIPLGVGLAFKMTDADVSGEADSVLIASFGAVDGRTYEPLGSSSYFGDVAPGVGAGSAYGIRTYVFNTTGAAAARNGFQATLAPHFTSLELRLKPDDNGDTTKYEIKALGIYLKN